jgi:hypothetical protein
VVRDVLTASITQPVGKLGSLKKQWLPTAISTTILTPYIPTTPSLSDALLMATLVNAHQTIFKVLDVLNALITGLVGRSN